MRAWPSGTIASPALASKEDYFAEASTAFFSSKLFRNNQYPFIHRELEVIDPEGYVLIHNLWLATSNPAPAYAAGDECRMDWVFPSHAPAANVVETCLILSASSDFDTEDTGFILNVVKFEGDTLTETTNIQKLDTN